MLLHTVYLLIYQLLCFLQIDVSLSQDTIKIVGLFHEDNYQAKIPFKAVISANNLLGKSLNIEPIIIDNIPKNDIRVLKDKVCKLFETEKSIAAIFGPNSDINNGFLESFISRFGVPYIQTTCYYSITKYTSANVLRLCPNMPSLSNAVARVVEHLEWPSFLILFEDNESLLKLQNVLKLQEFDEEGVKNKMKLVKLGPGPDYRSLFKEIANNSISNYIIDCKFDSIMNILNQAFEMKLMGPLKSFFLTSLDAHILDLSKFEAETNITTIRITNPEDKKFQDTVVNWKWIQYGEFSEIDVSEIKAETALTHDAVQLFIDAASAMNRIILPPKSLSCKSTRHSNYGRRIIDKMKQQTISTSLTGPIGFDDEGYRKQFQLQIVEINHSKVIATWDSTFPQNLLSNRSEEELQKTIEDDLKKTVVQIYSRIGPPFLMNKTAKPDEELTGNDRYEGFSMDLMQAVAYFVGFKFEFHINQDYGKYDPKTKQWNGLIREVIDKKAHMAICDLTITRQRRAFVDFSMPFMTLGISILLKKPEESDESKLFAFMDPFGVEVWIYTITLYLVITVGLYFIARLNLADWESPHPCDFNSEEVENIWDMKNCLWLTLGSIMTQGCDILPKGISSKTAVSTWWFFCLIMSSTYTANLAAFMTKQRGDAGVDNVEELAAQTKIKYGIVEGGATYSFFSESKYPVYQKMFANMLQSRPTVFCKNNEEGVGKVESSKNGLYAFLMESTQIEYVIETKCNLQQIGNWLDTKRFGIAMPMNAPYRSIINNAVLKLQENGTIELLKAKWWKQNRDEPSCESDEEGDDSDALALDSVGGVFVVLLIGVIIAYILGFLEFLWNVRNTSVERHLTYWEALKEESRFAANIWVTKKITKSDSESDISETGSKEVVKNIL